MSSRNPSYCAFGCLALVAITGCDHSAQVVSQSGSGGGEGDGQTSSAGSAGAAGAAGSMQDRCAVADPELASADADDLFNTPQVPVFDINLPQDEWEALQVNARDEEYVPAEVCFEGHGIGRVGLRFKGAVGSLVNCFDEQDQMICRKLSLKLKFSEYDTDQRFFGLKRLNFNANQHDDTRIKEKLAFDLYRSMGIVTPRASWAVVRVNGESQGLYGMVEQVDGRFTADRWPDNPDGNLYKELWPIYTDTDYITTHLKTNEETADISAFLAFSEAMTAASDDELRSTLGSYIDLDYFARVLAVGDAILDYDGLTYFWTDGDFYSNHNYYFYEEAPDAFTLIPWDVESTFWINPDHAAPHWTELPDDCSLTYEYWGGQAIAPGCDLVFRAMAADLGGWRAAGQEFLEGPFAEAAITARIDEYADFVRAEALADPTPYTYNPFDDEVEYLRGQIPTLRARFERLLAGLPWNPVAIDLTGVTGFEDQDDTTLLGPGTWLGANTNSAVSVAVNSVDPMAGAQDVLLSFEYSNEAEAWQQWSAYVVPVSPSPSDLTSLSGIRLWLRADEARTLRLALDSPESSGANDGIRYGWNVSVTDQPTQIEVLLADAAIQDWAITEGRDPGDDLQDILATTTGLVFEPQCLGRDTAGQLPDGTTDAGFIEMDDIEFF
jgi:spore coat protein H